MFGCLCVRIKRRTRKCAGGDAPQVGLDLDLAADLLLDLVVDNLALVEALEGEDVAARFGERLTGHDDLFLGADHVDAAELALAERLANLKVVERPDSRRSFAVRLSIRLLGSCVEADPPGRRVKGEGPL